MLPVTSSTSPVPHIPDSETVSGIGEIPSPKEVKAFHDALLSGNDVAALLGIDNAFKTIAKSITSFLESDPDENPWVHGKPIQEIIEVVAYDPQWNIIGKQTADTIKEALGDVALNIVHVGSTAVPGLSAKPVIDIDLIVKEPASEETYLPALEKLGYDLTVREPSYYQHRCLRLATPRVNVHIFGPECPEHIRHILFRDWLRNHSSDRELYMQAKNKAIDNVNVSNVMDYNQRKQQAVREIYQRIFEDKKLL